MRSAVLFLHGQYRSQDIANYKELAKKRFTIAVDGGYRFFKAAGIAPDLLVGDFDSLKRIPKNLPTTTEVIRAEVRKDATDAELAVEYCLKRGFGQIDIVQPSFGEPDHYLGNVMLLRLVERWNRRRKSNIGARLVSVSEEIILLTNASQVVRGRVGDRVSFVPLTDSRYTCTGTDYNVRGILIRPGETVGLRNKITAKRAKFTVTGEGLLVRGWSVASHAKSPAATDM
ncbi:thiamine diphosphokinase [bacterium]|nr:thiamine diphosphokinase [bacterium]